MLQACRYHTRPFSYRPNSSTQFLPLEEPKSTPSEGHASLGRRVISPEETETYWGCSRMAAFARKGLKSDLLKAHVYLASMGHFGSETIYSKIDRVSLSIVYGFLCHGNLVNIVYIF